ncbi:MAG: DeoR family transcriptional regulator, partial [Pseudomonadota bacterium]
MTARSERRRQEIARLVAARGEVRVEDLAERFDASRETIRRDLTSLEDTGALLKLHGGAKRVPAAVEGSFDERMAENHAQKAIIGQKLSRWLSPGQLIFMDTGSTT